MQIELLKSGYTPSFAALNEIVTGVNLDVHIVSRYCQTV
jgi:hypothetical protein